MPPVSHSLLSKFETCPWRYYLTSVSREVAEVESEAAAWGTAVHAAIEDRVKHNKELPDYLAHLEPVFAKLLALPGEHCSERKLAVNADLHPTGWDAADAWFRGIVDYMIINPPKAVVFDIKTGKRKIGSDQLELMAGLVFAHYPEVERVATGYIWLKDSAVDSETIEREASKNIWLKLSLRVARLEHSFSNNKWPKKPSGLCRKWCPVGSKNCEFCGV